jgi:hypothetical protein
MAQAQDQVNVAMPNVLRDRLAGHRLHPRMALHEVIEEALDFWEECGGWSPYLRAPVDGYSGA